MVQAAEPLRDAEALIVELEQAEADGDGVVVASRLPELEKAIAFLMDVNYRLAGTDAANTLVASLQLRARILRDRHRARQ